MRLRSSLAAVLTAAALASCASTTFDSTWKAPDAGVVDYSGKKVAAVFVSADESTRRAAEDTLARQISARGAQGVAAYTVVSTDELKDEEAARDKLQRSGCSGVVMMRLAGKEQQVTATPGTWTSARYSSFTHYSEWGWDAVYEPGYLVTDTIVSVETLVYSLERDQLLWAGMSETFNPSKVEPFVKELAAAVAERMKEEGLIR